ncbi:hypothetical protein [Nocardiopsis sp. NRRL B-16309]|uniref:hypothetical protein n=1 Tax=Nocardiopsis sp. NRRL B-16309 TaxID=1519494 RepID=UPI0006AF8906|nr:hypothetical protein [Nocardiopsis sp. NRRL B-16309]KOX13675.1 hypothetical protein ADL05_18495 [Nocardiopsis sp. NRRL B-16309]
MMTTIRTARRPRRCAHDCGVPIRAGEKVAHTAIPPRSHAVLYSDQWIHLAAHVGTCPDADTMPVAELAAARAEMDAYLQTRLEELEAAVAALNSQTAGIGRTRSFA